MDSAVNSSFVGSTHGLRGLVTFGSSGSILSRLRGVGHRGGRHFTSCVGARANVILGPSSVFSVRIGHLRRCGHRRLGILGVVDRCRFVGGGPGTPFAPGACVFNTGTTPNCLFTGRIVRVVCGLSILLRGSPSIGSGLGVLFLRGCYMATTRVVVPSTSVDRRVSLTSARTSNANGVGLVVGNTIAVNARSNTGIRVRGRINSDGVVVFNVRAPRILHLRGRNCSPCTCCGGGPILHRTLSFVNGNFNNVDFSDVCGSLGGGSGCVTLTSFNSCRTTRGGTAGLCGGGRG